MLDDKQDSFNGQKLISKFLEISKWPNTILLSQKNHESYLFVSDLFLFGIIEVDQEATVSAIH